MINKICLTIFLAIASTVVVYSQSMEKIVIEHIGEIDKPFPILKLYAEDTTKTTSPNAIIISGKKIYTKIYEYLTNQTVGKVSKPKMTYGTFCVSFYESNKVEKLYLNRQGAVFLLVNIHWLLPVSENGNREIIEGMVRRLL